MKQPDAWAEIAGPETPPRRFRVSLAEIMGIIAVAAVGLKWPPVWIVAVPVAGLWITAKFGRPTAVKVVSIIVAFHTPALIGLTLDCSHCREFWLRLWPMIPGGVLFEATRGLLGIGRSSDLLSSVMAGVTTLALISGFVAVGLKGRAAWIAALAFSLLYSSFAYFVASQVIRM